jgi:hypothetical protein
MQKVIAFSIDVNQLVSHSSDTFGLSEPEELNQLLAEGWEIEDWSFLTDDPINGKMPMLVVLNDDVAAAMAEADEMWEEDEFSEEDLEEVAETDDEDELDAE